MKFMNFQENLKFMGVRVRSLYHVVLVPTIAWKPVIEILWRGHTSIPDAAKLLV